MLLQKQTAIRVNESLYELQVHGSPIFPFQAYLNEFSGFHKNFADWHCHTELEFTVVLKGRFVCGINDQHYELMEGEGVFINSNGLHMSRPTTEVNDSVTFSLVFSSEFLVENIESLLYQDFVQPMIRNPYFKGCLLTNHVPWQKELLSYLWETYELCEREEGGLEFSVRNRILRAWEILYEHQKFEIEEKSKSSSGMIYEERAKELLKFIQTHYGENIGIKDMVKACNLSRTDCFRCFRTIIGKSPIEYLNDYRLKQAMFLLETTNQTITEICMECGFTHPSYFGKLFRQVTGISPKEYRKVREKTLM